MISFLSDFIQHYKNFIWYFTKQAIIFNKVRRKKNAIMYTLKIVTPRLFTITLNKNQKE